MTHRERRRLLSPPRIRTLEDADDTRHATWLELFFDLAFVVAVAQLASALSRDLTLELGLHHRHEGGAEVASSAEAFVP